MQTIFKNKSLPNIGDLCLWEKIGKILKNRDSKGKSIEMVFKKSNARLRNHCIL